MKCERNMTGINSKSGLDSTITIPPSSAYLQDELFKTRSISWSIAAIIVVCFTTGMLIGSYLTFKSWDVRGEEGNDSYYIQGLNVSGCPDALKVITRKGWKAKQPKRIQRHTDVPYRVIIAHRATEKCSTQHDCASLVRNMQSYHVDQKKWDDIAYSYLVGGDGAAYIGRGWDLVGAHTRSFNDRSICIGFIGNFNQTEPTDNQLCAAKQLIAEGLRQKSS